MIQCDTCKYRGELPNTQYAGNRCTNKNAIFYQCPTDNLVRRVHTPCKRYKEIKNEDNSNETSVQ